jgi:hypothetical protein
MLTVEPITDPMSANAEEARRIDNVVRSKPHLSQIRHLIPQVQFVYDVTPTGLCGCYFEHDERQVLEQELQDATDDDLRSKVSTVAYPDRDPKEAARLWWERKHRALTSLGHYLADAVQDEPVMLLVAFEGEVGLPAPEQQTITPAYFTQAQSLALQSNTLFTVVAEGNRYPSLTLESEANAAS